MHSTPPTNTVQHFKAGTQLSDPDAMVSLAEMIDRHYFNPTGAYEVKKPLWKRAAELGHAGAVKALEQDLCNQHTPAGA